MIFSSVQVEDLCGGDAPGNLQRLRATYRRERRSANYLHLEMTMRTLENSEIGSVSGAGPQPLTRVDNPLDPNWRDPSPGDGILGLRVTIRPDGNLVWTPESDGYFDLIPNGTMDGVEGPYEQGGTQTTNGGWGSYDENWESLQTWRPLPNSSGPMM